MKIKGSFIIAAVLAGLPGAIFAPEPLATASHTLVVTAYEYTFQAPDSVAEGAITVRLVNRGKQGHQVVFARLDDTTTLIRAMRSLVDDKTRTTGLHWVGGVESSVAGGTSEATLALQPGRYIIVCEYGENGHAHASMGMVRSLVVTASAATSDTKLPAAPVTARLSDYRIHLSAPLHAGRQLVRVENDGAHRHHLVIVRIVGTASVAEIDKWDGKSEPAPVSDIGAGAAALDPGEASVIPLTLAPGRYLLGCILSDGPDSKPHFLLGMEREVDIQ